MKQSAIRKANKALYTRIVAGVGGLLAGALSLGLSIYETRTGAEVEQVASGTAVNTGQWKVTLVSANTADQTPDGLHVADGKKVLTIDLTLENLTAESSNLYRDTLKLENIPNAPIPQFYLPRDRDVLWDLQPRMPEVVKAAWELPASQKLPDIVKVTIVGTTYKAKDNLYAAPGWFNPTDVARVDLPLSPATGGTLP
ncbi:hypothetical protein [Rhizobium sp. SYY.PMSO]|uniref:hypothetical protein n=1 Tax=Rhizobium sp. SYY.PMSO TaxID=3382192 RepID=UPI000DDC7B64